MKGARDHLDGANLVLCLVDGFAGLWEVFLCGVYGIFGGCLNVLYNFYQTVSLLYEGGMESPGTHEFRALTRY